ncbi:MAG: hypothetical protein JSV00_02580, partial [bacterium]
YFTASAEVGNSELWVYDDDTDSAQMVTDLYPGGSSSPWGLIVYGGMLFFGAEDGSGRTLWSYNGVDAPAKVAGASTVQTGYDDDGAVFDGSLYFSGYNTASGFEPWRYDMLAAPSMLADINSAGGSYPWQFFVY